MKIDEEAFLKKLAGIIDDPDIEKTALDEIEKKSRERKLLEQFEQALSNQTTKIEEIQTQIEKIEVEESAEEITETPIVEDLAPQAVLPVQDLTNPSIIKLRDTPAPDYEKVVSKLKDGFQKELDLMKKAIIDLHQFATGMSNMGGGGAGDVTTLDHPVILVTDDYTANRRDYYIGVDAIPDGIKCCATITLPFGNVKNGRKYVIKDESGQCSQYNIKVVVANNGTIDGKICPVYMQIDYMSLTFIYRNGWRII